MIYIVLASHNRCDTTLQCLETLSQRGVLAWANVVLTDSGSTDGTPAQVARHFPQIELIKTGSDLWWTGATEIGMRHAVAHSADCIVWLNDDCRPMSNALEALTAYARAHNCIATAQAYTPDGYRYGGQIKTPCGLKSVTCARDEVQPCDCCNGNCVAIPTPIVQAIGYPDTRALPHTRADSDYGLRATKAGYGCTIVGNAICENDTNTRPHMQSWLLSKDSMRAIWTSGLARHSPFTRCNRNFFVRHWGPWGYVLFVLPYLRFFGIAIARTLMPRSVLHTIHRPSSARTTRLNKS